MSKAIREFFSHESAVGIILIAMTILAMVIANSPLNSYYQMLLDTHIKIMLADSGIDKPILLWVNDGLMAIFFLMVGLEIKKEAIEGELRDIKRVTIPAMAAVGGMVVPALIYALFNWNSDVALRGWAIPSATDIAFALGILSLLGKKVPPVLKLFLLTLAIIDDLGAIIIIALFYTSSLSITALSVAGVCIAILWILNKKGVTNSAIYILIGITLWIATLKSGVHATLAGVIVGLFIPLKDNKASFEALEESLKVPVNYFILPIFAFVNTGIDFFNVTLNDFTNSITLGIIAGLVIGKQAGIFLFSYLAIKLGIGKMPNGVDFKMLYGVAILGGVGFTMSLFIGSLAFEGGSNLPIVDERVGILIGSLISGVFGYLYLRFATSLKG